MAVSTVVINGKLYDARTGLPIEEKQHKSVEPVAVEQATAPVESAAPADEIATEPANKVESTASRETTALAKTAVAAARADDAAEPTAPDSDADEDDEPHIITYSRAERHQPLHHKRAVAKSHTLNRQFVKKPASASGVHPSRDHQIRPAVPTSPLVQKFAPADDHVVSVHVKAARKAPEPTPEKPVEQHQPVLSAPVEKRLAAHAATRVAPPDQTAKQLKEALLREQMDSPIVNKKPAKTRRKFRASTIVATACALVILGGYLAYVNMPSISVRVAASRAGVDAKYPGYNPGGYRLDGPVAYAPGQVTINYRANGADWKYSLTQTNSTWDSTAVLENRVTPETNDYETLNQKGLTIYRFNNKAAWVNGGVLYTIDGDAALSNDQVLRIVDSI